MPDETAAVLSSTSARSPYRRGYTTPRQLRGEISAAHQTSLARTLTIAILDHLSIIAATVGAGIAIPFIDPLPGILVAITTIFLVARQLRALENLVHEASHYNWCRHHRRLNDFLAKSVAAVPAGVRIADYRSAHLLHHGRFGTAQDPDRQRYEALALEELDRTRLGRFSLGLLRRFGRYQRDWLKSFSAGPLDLAGSALWSICLIGLPAGITGGAGSAGVSLTIMAFAYLLALPLLRFIAESSEHTFRAAGTVFEATISNLGFCQRLLFHPHADGYHTVHHLWPGIPHHQLRSIHRLLLRHDQHYALGLRYRSRVLSAPKAGGQLP